MNTNKNRGIDIVNRTFMADYPADAGRAVDQLSRRDAVAFLSGHEADVVAGIWRYISPARTAELVSSLEDDALSRILPLLEPGVCAATLRLVTKKQYDRCLALMPESTAAEIEQLMTYPPNSAGRIMDSRVLTFRTDQSVG